MNFEKARRLVADLVRVNERYARDGHYRNDVRERLGRTVSRVDVGVARRERDRAPRTARPFRGAGGRRAWHSRASAPRTGSPRSCSSSTNCVRGRGLRRCADRAGRRARARHPARSAGPGGHGPLDDARQQHRGGRGPDRRPVPRVPRGRAARRARRHGARTCSTPCSARATSGSRRTGRPPTRWTWPPPPGSCRVTGSSTSCRTTSPASARGRPSTPSPPRPTAPASGCSSTPSPCVGTWPRSRASRSPPPRPSPAPRRRAARTRRRSAPPRREDGGVVRVLFYGRPSKHRNLFRLGVAALRVAVQELADDGLRVEFHSAGEQHGDVELDGGRGDTKLVSHGTMPWDDYFRFIASTGVVLSLQHSPHPSHPPFDGAISGARVVTNEFRGTRAALHPNLTRWPADARSLGLAVAEAVRRTAAAGPTGFVPLADGALGGRWTPPSTRSAPHSKQRTAPMTRTTLVVVPVYGDLESLLRCVDGLVAHLDTTVHRVLLVKRLRPGRRHDRAGAPRAHRRPCGLPVRAERPQPRVRRHLQPCGDRLDTGAEAVLLLNSDAVPTAGFLDAMLAVLDEDRTGVVTARSDNATIASIPYRLTNRGAARTEARTRAVWDEIAPLLPVSQVLPVAMASASSPAASWSPSTGSSTRPSRPATARRTTTACASPRTAGSPRSRTARSSCTPAARASPATAALRAAHQRELERATRSCPTRWPPTSGTARPRRSASPTSSSPRGPTPQARRGPAARRGRGRAGRSRRRGLRRRLRRGGAAPPPARRPRPRGPSRTTTRTPTTSSRFQVLVDPTPRRPRGGEPSGRVLGGRADRPGDGAVVVAAARAGGADRVVDLVRSFAEVVTPDGLERAREAVDRDVLAPLDGTSAALERRWAAFLPLDLAAAETGARHAPPERSHVSAGSSTTCAPAGRSGPARPSPRSPPVCRVAADGGPRRARRVARRFAPPCGAPRSRSPSPDRLDRWARRITEFGVLDREYLEAQTGRTFASDDEAVPRLRAQRRTARAVAQPARRARVDAQTPARRRDVLVRRPCTRRDPSSSRPARSSTPACTPPRCRRPTGRRRRRRPAALPAGRDGRDRRAPRASRPSRTGTDLGLPPEQRPWPRRTPSRRARSTAPGVATGRRGTRRTPRRRWPRTPRGRRTTRHRAPSSSPSSCRCTAGADVVGAAIDSGSSPSSTRTGAPRRRRRLRRRHGRGRARPRPCRRPDPPARTRERRCRRRPEHRPGRRPGHVPRLPRRGQHLASRAPHRGPRRPARDRRPRRAHRRPDGRSAQTQRRRRDRAARETYRGEDGTHEDLLAGNFIDLNALVVRRDVADAVGPFDEDLRRWIDWEWLLRISAHAAVPAHVPVLGVDYDNVRDPRRVSSGQPASWQEVVLARHRIDWDALAAAVPERVADRCSIVVPVFANWTMTRRAVDTVLGAADLDGDDVEVVLVDNGSPRSVSAVLDAWVPRGTRASCCSGRTATANFALGSDLGLARSTGATVVMLNNDTEVGPGWLRPLVTALDDPTVLGVQPLLVYPDGVVQAAGTVFGGDKVLPWHFLGDHPRYDADRAFRTPASRRTTRDHRSRRGLPRGRPGALARVRPGVRERTRGRRPVPARPRAGRARRGVPRRNRPRWSCTTRAGRRGATTPASTNRRVFDERWRGRYPAPDAAERYDAAGLRYLGSVDPGLPKGHAVMVRSPRARSWRVPTAQRPAIGRRASASPSSTTAAGRGRHRARDGTPHRRARRQVDMPTSWYRGSSGLDDVTVLIAGTGPALGPQPGARNAGVAGGGPGRARRGPRGRRAGDRGRGRRRPGRDDCPLNAGLSIVHRLRGGRCLLFTSDAHARVMSLSPM